MGDPRATIQADISNRELDKTEPTVCNEFGEPIGVIVKVLPLPTTEKLRSLGPITLWN